MKIFKKKVSSPINFKKYKTVILAIIVALACGFFFTTYKVASQSNSNSSSAVPEIQKILSLKTTAEQSQELIKLMDRVGPVEAQNLMYKSGLPFTGETHLLIHTVGNYIFQKYGLDGLPYCREYFLSACYHGFIINTLADYHMEGMVKAMEKCQEEGAGVASQCAHAAGHGFVAWQDYDLIKSLKMCDELGGLVENFANFNCYDGVFMENLWGVHGGVPSEKRWIKDDDIYYPCDDSRIPEKYLNGCWSNQASLMYQHFKGDLKKTAEGCDAVENPLFKQTCYNNFARQIHPLTEGKKEKVVSLCQNATGQEWQEYCMITNMTASWSVGDRVLPFDLCSSFIDPLESRCFDQLIGMINFDYGQKPAEKKIYCDKITNEAEKDRCLNVQINQSGQ